MRQGLSPTAETPPLFPDAAPWSRAWVISLFRRRAPARVAAHPKSR